MVPAFDTLVAEIAVMRSRRRQDLAARADVIRVEVLQKILDMTILTKIAFA